MDAIIKKIIEIINNKMVKNKIMSTIQRYHVASGSYYVGESKPLILEAVLGTCVGLAMCDPENGIGGISHLLLAEPRSRTDSFKPEKYATTGLPIFLNALVQAGASPGNLSAWIAGGALVGPLADYDLELDIGGQTAERVLEFLANKKINVKKSETGGFFTCNLNLNMQTWECTIEPVGFGKLGPENRARMPTADEINQTMVRLQPIPQVALKILRIIHEDNYDLSALTEEIRKDQVLSARTLKLCNSVYFGSRYRIASLEHALVYLGQKLLIKFVISASVNNFFNQVGMGYSLCKGGIFHHAVGTAVIAEKIAEAAGKASPSLAYMAGLLHDIGKVVLDQYIQGVFPLFYRELYEAGKNFSEAERTILGFDHSGVGTTLAQQWSFPDSLLETIAFHHKPEDAVQHRELVHIVYLADLLMSRFHAGLEVERLNTDALSTRLETLGLSMKKFPDIVDMIPLKVLESSPEMALMRD
ncbi:MAG: HDOD domain-containing protein [Desulfobacterales bacterium]|nr:MAG: HDOD domain-containing protein [Desulfobacterales bacterium]